MHRKIYIQFVRLAGTTFTNAWKITQYARGEIRNLSLLVNVFRLPLIAHVQ